MLVHAKMPHIDAQITGTGADILIETLKRSITGLKVTSEDEAIPLNSDPWFQKPRKAEPPEKYSGVIVIMRASLWKRFRKSQALQNHIFPKWKTINVRSV